MCFSNRSLILRFFSNMTRITLYVFQLKDNEPYINASPFCIKMITFLKVANLEHNIVEDALMMRKNPKGKMPFIELDGKVVGDSRLILERFKKDGIVDLDSGLNNLQKSISLAFRRMLEEHTYWHIVHNRWDKNWLWVKKTYFYSFSWLLTPILWYIRRTTLNNAYAAGVGRLTISEQFILIKQDVEALESLINESSSEYFFSSSTPTNLDITAFSFIYALISVPVNDPAITYVKEKCPRLIKFVKNMLKIYFPSEYNQSKNIF
eukprot:NODE_18_length_47517_cov_0.674814.p17 type:complete len:264 gc:universal NODE_18_length_47517_cov_0.674814:36120-35329(-)